MALAECHRAGVYNTEMARRFPENVCTPVQRLDIIRGLMNAKYELLHSIIILVGTDEPGNTQQHGAAVWCQHSQHSPA